MKWKSRVDSLYLVRDGTELEVSRSFRAGERVSYFRGTVVVWFVVRVDNDEGGVEVGQSAGGV